MSETRRGIVIDKGNYDMPPYVYTHSKKVPFAAINYTASNILYFEVEAEDTIAGSSNVAYRFTVVPRHRVVKGAYLVVQLPPKLKIGNVKDLSSDCQSVNKPPYFSGFVDEFDQCHYD